MNPFVGVVGRLGAGALRATVAGAPTGALGLRARLAVADADRALDQFDRKTKKAIQRALNEAMRNAHSATVRDTLAQSGIKLRKALTQDKGQRGRIRWYKATDANLHAALFIGLKSEPGLTLVRTGAVTGKPATATINKANRRKRAQGKQGQKAAERAVNAGALPNLTTTKGRPYSKLFWAQMPSGHVGVFARRGRKRLQIDEPYLAIRDIAARIGTAHVERQFRDTYPRALRRNLGI